MNIIFSAHHTFIVTTFHASDILAIVEYTLDSFGIYDKCELSIPNKCFRSLSSIVPQKATSHEFIRITDIIEDTHKRLMRLDVLTVISLEVTKVKISHFVYRTVS